MKEGKWKFQGEHNGNICRRKTKWEMNQGMSLQKNQCKINKENHRANKKKATKYSTIRSMEIVYTTLSIITLTEMD